ncbi:hypothetical protein FSP39_019572 [Pinctada imbricata]|uniref:Fibrinogen C-terminal domain-containing protein n=1 Tax=Pinctada imbricata TaxID=66713 RepID=A0AA88YP84_PINIB|nr:hypothetical protein FSP39_019572 [Pinctada imbricata]
MKWIYPLVATFIRLAECQIVMPITKCPILEEIARMNAEKNVDMKKEIEVLKKEQRRLSNGLSSQRNWMKDVMVQSNGIMDCMWYKTRNSDAQNGVYNLIVGDRDFQAYCDMETDGGGWTVIVSRDPDSSTDMNRSWQEYKHGFGNETGPFYWIGNDNIHELTKQRPSEVYFKIEHQANGLKWAKYINMTVLSEEYKYRLSFDENSFEGSMGIHFCPDLTFVFLQEFSLLTFCDNYTDRCKLKSTNFVSVDILGGDGNQDWNVQGMVFTTFDNDNDGNCATINKGGWWYNNCGYSMTNHTFIMGFEKSELRPDNMMMIRSKNPK